MIYKSLEQTPAFKYAEAIMNGKESFILNGEKKHTIVGNYVKLAVERFFRDIENRHFELDWKQGYKPIQFTETIQRHWEGKKVGQPFILEPHQHFHWMNQYGWKTPEGVLRYNRSFKQVARKNGKTTECGVKSIYHISQKERGLECWVGATKEDQAIITVDEASKFIRHNPFLKSKFEFVNKAKKVKAIVNATNLNSIRVLGRDSDTQDGSKPSYVVIDEYHEHKDTGTIDVLESGMGNRENPIVDIITTAGFNKHYPCYANTRKGIIDVLEGRIENERMFGLIYELDKDDDYEDPKNWYKANPNLGVSNNIDQLNQMLINAKMEGHTKIINFKTKNLNMWVDAPDQWIDTGLWFENTTGMKESEIYGKRGFGGLDLASSNDFNSFAICVPHNGKYCFKVLHWLPANKIHKRKDGNDFRAMVAAGWIKISGEDVVDYRTIADDIIKECKKYKIEEVAYDPYNQAHGCIALLIDAGIKCSSLYQGVKTMSLPTKMFEHCLSNREIEHFNNPVLTWEMGNVVLDYKEHDHFIISKKKSGNKIDGVAACLDAFCLALSNPNEKSKTRIVYI